MVTIGPDQGSLGRESATISHQIRVANTNGKKTTVIDRPAALWQFNCKEE
jgi:hypothetical protein